MKLIKKLWSLFETKDKKKFIFLVFISFFVAIFEMLSVLSIIPFFGFILNYENIIKQPLISNFLIYFDYLSKDQIILIAILLFIGIFIIKNTFVLFFHFYLNKFLFGIKKKTANKIYKKYINESYLFYIKNKSSKLISNINSEISVFIISFLQPTLIIFSEILISLGLIFVLFYLNPNFLITTIVLISMFLMLLFKIFKKRMDAIAVSRQNNEFKKMSFLQQGLTGIKETKIYLAENFFYNNFKKSNDSLINAENKIANYQPIPKNLFEIILIIFFSIFVLFLKNMNLSTTTILTKLGVLSLIGVRFIPMVNKISNAVTRIRVGLPAFLNISSICLEISEEINRSKKNFCNKQELVQFKKNIIIKNLSYSYNNQKILENINIEINKGKIIGLLGMSGSGKTTLLNILMGFLSDYKGEIFIDNIENNLKNKKWEKKISYVPQDIIFLNDTIRKNVAYGHEDSQINQKQIDLVLEKAGIKTFVSNLKNKDETNLSDMALNISGGQRQRLGLARALYFQPEFLILDEATSSLDEMTEKEILSNLKETKGNLTILMTTHRKSALEFCDNVFEIKDGTIAEN